MMKVNQRDVLPSTCRSPMNGQISSIQHILIMLITVMQICIHSIRFEGSLLSCLLRSEIQGFWADSQHQIQLPSFGISSMYSSPRNGNCHHPQDRQNTNMDRYNGSRINEQRGYMKEPLVLLLPPPRQHSPFLRMEPYSPPSPLPPYPQTVH